MNKKSYKKMLVSGVVITLSFLPGCIDMSKKGGEQAPTSATEAAMPEPLKGEVLVTMKGTPIITTDSLAKEKEKLLKAHPQLRQAVAMIDAKELDRNILEGLINQKIIDEYIVANKINERADYQNELAELYESMDRVLNTKFFTEQKAVVVPESEVRSFYETNKDKIPGLMVSQGGVAATGLEFADGAAARAFAARAKTSPGGFKKVAQDDGLTPKIRDFKLVHNQSIGIDEKLRDRIAAIKSVPSVEVFEVNGMFWVINATAKEEPKYIPYDQVKEALKQQLEQNKRSEMFAKEVDDLKKQYGIEINEDYFEPAEKPAQTAAVQTENVKSVAQKEVVEKRIA